MDDRLLYLKRQQAERPAFSNVLRALPGDRIDYKPHERSPSAQALVWTLASETSGACDIVTEGRLEWSHPKPPALTEMISIFETSHARLLEKVGALDEAAWNRPAQMFFDGKLMLEQPAGEFLWFLLFDAIHHRGQLSAYLRPMGGRVPAIYGPSADSRG